MSGELYFLLSETIVFRKTVDTGGTSAFKGDPHPSVIYYQYSSNEMHFITTIIWVWWDLRGLVISTVWNLSRTNSY